jgi:hypothetical protein
MMEAVRTSETSVDNQFTRQYTPEDSSEHRTEDGPQPDSDLRHEVGDYFQNYDKSRTSREDGI